MVPVLTHAEQIVSVKLKNYIGNSSSMTLKAEGDYLSLSPTFQLKKGVTYQLSVESGKFILSGNGETVSFEGAFAFYPKEYDSDHLLFINDRPYMGAMEFTIEDQQYIRPVNHLYLEDYLKGVVPFEVYPSWEMETLKAQSLAARTYAITHLNQDQMMNDTVQFQAYGGYIDFEKTKQAVEETKGQIITYDGRPIGAFYSASNGGITENNANVWGGKALRYFPIQKDPYDPVLPWEFTLHQTQINIEDINWDVENIWDQLQEKDEKITSNMKRWLKRKGVFGDIKILSIPRFTMSSERNESGRALKGSISIVYMQRMFDGMILLGQKTLKNVPMSHIRPMIGGTIFKSYLIDSLEKENGVYVMKGRGFGHGVGMSQWGANGMAEEGKTYREIIDYYYPGTSITNINERQDLLKP
ncbi:SpoIID/LytB domain protein [Melghiribacillus thermohalophilus]|uniref:SpoIID/LytB domain protein n=1 Tax=Melghiribacillus thermohalophilus TaxID=1324956 RepID=A0A4R3MW54_9BACI|nr:SpoIID/LytB domain-containing protein [Melghiribacillus thermohalophilus]TCT19671.1 SpoIID/LytB domain protein [Melghiribacillus thermohalophilus]